MKRIPVILLCAAAVLAVAIPSFAHDEYRIIGVVTRTTPTSLAVRQRSDSKVIGMKVDKQTIVTRNGKTVDRAEVKVGASVVVDALGDTIEDLLVVEVRLVPPPSAPKG